MNLKQKLIEVRKHIGTLQKTERGNANAMYVDPAVILKKAMDKMNEVGVLLTSEVVESSLTREHAPTKNKPDQKDFVVHLKMLMTFHDADSDETLPIQWFAIGSHMTDPSMAGGGGMTYNERYFFMKQFNIPTTKDDPEFLDEKVNGPRLIDDGQIKRINDLIDSKGIDRNKMLAWLKIGSVEEIHAANFQNVLNILRSAKGEQR